MEAAAQEAVAMLLAPPDKLVFAVRQPEPRGSQAAGDGTLACRHL